MAASESEFSISSSSNSLHPRAPASRLSTRRLGGDCVALKGLERSAQLEVEAFAPAGDALRWDGWNRSGLPRRRPARHGLGIRTGIGRFEIDDVAEEGLSLVELVAPDDDRLKRQRTLA